MLQNLLKGSPLIANYKAFMKSHLDYGDKVFDKAYKIYFLQKRGSVQNNPWLVLTGATRKPRKKNHTKSLDFWVCSFQLFCWFPNSITLVIFQADSFKNFDYDYRNIEKNFVSKLNVTFSESSFSLPIKYYWIE